MTPVDEQMPTWFKVFGDALDQRLRSMEGMMRVTDHNVRDIRVKVTETNGKVIRSHERIDDVVEDIDDIKEQRREERAEAAEERRHFGIRRTTLVGAAIGGTASLLVFMATLLTTSGLH